VIAILLWLAVRLRAHEVTGSAPRPPAPRSPALMPRAS
jgi:hypothetical protein